MKIYGKKEEITNTQENYLFSKNDAKKLANSRRYSKIKEIFTRLKESIKLKGEKTEEYERNR